MTDDQLLRYSRHILLGEIGIEGQERINAAHALIIGLGGLGSPAALYLAAAGVGRITLVDDDTVDLTNLQRQIAHTTPRAGASKVASAQAAMLAINPDILIDAIQQKASQALLDGLVANCQVVLDCTDNFATRHAINAACVTHNKPLVSGSAIRLDGQLSVYHAAVHPQAPCYACVFPPEQHFEETACSTLGVLGPLVGMVGTMQAVEALKILAGIGSQLIGKLVMIDGKRMAFDEIQLIKNERCAVCGSRQPSLRSQS
ncbi:MAG: HesA/MoeB/ThiF family protein [Cytophagales bacterium]|nr:HesA/MoeB/ThiF family protein [Cytophagales bacterium]